MKAEKF